jgi:hypothetical protein
MRIAKTQDKTLCIPGWNIPFPACLFVVYLMAADFLRQAPIVLAGFFYMP